RGGMKFADVAPAIGAPSSSHWVATVPPDHFGDTQVARAAENTTPGEMAGRPDAFGPAGETRHANVTSKLAPSGFVAFSVTTADPALAVVPEMTPSLSETRFSERPAGSPSAVSVAMFVPVTRSASIAAPSTLDWSAGFCTVAAPSGSIVHSKVVVVSVP